jgi:hypothetical protein
MSALFDADRAQADLQHSGWSHVIDASLYVE